MSLEEEGKRKELKWDTADVRPTDLDKYEVKRPRKFGKWSPTEEVQIIEGKLSTRPARPVVDFFEETSKIAKWTQMSEKGEGLLIKLNVDRDRLKELSVGIERNLESLREEASL